MSIEPGSEGATRVTPQAHTGQNLFRYARYLGDRWRRIGPRLLASLLLLIIPTVVVGVVAEQRFASLTATTTELSSQDLPEIVTLDHMRSLLYEERGLLRTLALPPLALNSSSQSAVAKLISEQQTARQLLEQPSTTGTLVLVQSLDAGIARNSALVQNAGKLINAGRLREVQNLIQRQHLPLMETLIGTITKLSALEYSETATAAATVQRESQTATQLIFALILLTVPLSVTLALLLTRSLTHPLAALLQATKALATGDLDASPHLTSVDEIGQLASAFDAMRANLRAKIAELALERRHTQAIIDASADGVILVNEAYQVVQMNPAAEELTGWPAPDAIGQSCWTVCGCDNGTPGVLCDNPVAESMPDGTMEPLPARGLAAQHCSVCPRRMTIWTPDANISQELHVHLPSGQQRWLAVSCAPIHSEDETTQRRQVVSLHDITQLKALDQMKSDFVAMVSHELRAPVTTVGGAVEMLSQIDPGSDDGSYREVLGILEQQTRRLRTVVNEVLQVTRLEAGRLPVHLGPLALTEFLYDLLQRVGQEWIDSPCSISFLSEDEHVSVWADPAMLEIVLRNLLDNARKYGPPGSPLEVSVCLDAPMHRARVRVTDHGPGIPPDQMEHIFERFSRGSQSSTQWTRGYGLGLYIARELVRAHNGEIWAENHADGSSFVLTLCTVDVDETHQSTRWEKAPQDVPESLAASRGEVGTRGQ